MSFIEKTWHDYPPNTTTPITAQELNRIETGITGAYAAADTAQTTAVTTATGFAKNYLIDSYSSVNPKWTRSKVETAVTLGTTSITCTVAKADFDPEVDGVMIWQGNFLFLTDYYTFDTTTDPDNVIISFAENMRTRFELSTSIEIVIYEKPPDSGGSRTYGTSSVYSPLGLSASTIATNMTDLTPQLKSVTDTSDNARSSVNLGRLCTNVGGVCMIFVMHRCAVSINDGTGGTWTQINVSHTAQYEDGTYEEHGMSIFWRQITANVPLTVTVTGTASQRLYASAVIYEGKSTVMTVERTNAATYETLYFNTSEQTDGLVSSPTASASSIDIWCLTVEYLNNFWCKALDTTYDPSDAEVSHPDSGETNRLAIYAGGGTRFIAYADESKQCKSYLGFYINRNVITNADFESAVQFLHVTVS